MSFSAERQKSHGCNDDRGKQRTLTQTKNQHALVGMHKARLCHGISQKRLGPFQDSKRAELF